jgi:hypothetical protein
MSRFESALENCLERLAGGEASLEDCLRSYPEFSEELRPLLKAASQVRRVAEVQASPEFKRRGRARLVAYMRAHPHRQVTYRIRGLIPVYRLAVGLTVLAVAVFAAGTAFAQSAMPGDLLYSWKLASESAWLVVSPDPVGTDLALAERRILEIQSSSGSARNLALHGYQLILNRLVSQTDPVVQQSIHPILAAQSKFLAQAGISVPDLDEYLSPQPTKTPPPQPTIPAPVLPNMVTTPALQNLTATPALPLELPRLGLPPILTTPTP